MPVGTLVKESSQRSPHSAHLSNSKRHRSAVHVTELSDQPFGKVEDVVSKGEEVTAKVIKLDPEHKKIALSIKEYLIEKNKMNRDDIVVGNTKPKQTKKGKEKKKNPKKKLCRIIRDF